MAYKFWPARCVQKKKCKENTLALGILCFLFIKLWKREKVGIAMFQRDMRHYSVELITLSNTTLSNLLIKTSRKGEIITKGRCPNLKWAACLCCSALFISRGSSKHPSSNGKVFIWSECIWPYLGQPLSIFFFSSKHDFHLSGCCDWVCEDYNLHLVHGISQPDRERSYFSLWDLSK